MRNSVLCCLCGKYDETSQYMCDRCFNSLASCTGIRPDRTSSPGVIRRYSAELLLHFILADDDTKIHRDLNTFRADWEK